jgi:diguanylate cyclase (GGDEF)-like protein
LSRGTGARIRWVRPQGWAIRELPKPTLGYVLAIDLVAVGLLYWALGRTPVHAHDMITAAVLIGGAMLTVEALRRIGEPAGTFSDLQLAWTLPMALLLPPVYAMLAPVPLTVLSHFRIKYTVIYRRTFSTSVLGLTNLGAAFLFRGLIDAPLFGAVPVHDWMRHAPAYAGLGLFAGLLATFADYLIVIVAVKTSDPDATWRGLISNRETYILEFVEACSGVLVTVLAAVHAALVAIAVPPMLLLQRSILHGQLTAAARVDQKTGLLNAGTWNREAERELTTAARARRPASLLLVDLDHFKQVNDQHGHLVGDEVLKLVADALAGQVRKDDLAGRFGGEEFVLLLTDTPQAEAGLIAERLRTRIAGMTVEGADSQPVGTTVSIGIASQGRDGSDLMELLAAADTALYRAKSAGRNRTCLASDTS